MNCVTVQAMQTRVLSGFEIFKAIEDRKEHSR